MRVDFIFRKKNILFFLKKLVELLVYKNSDFYFIKLLDTLDFEKCPI